jgi:hypothetical protein
MYDKEVDRVPIAVPIVNELRILPPCPLLIKQCKEVSENHPETSPVLLNLDHGDCEVKPKWRPDKVTLDEPDAGILHRSQRESAEDSNETPSESVKQVELAVIAIRRDLALSDPIRHKICVCDAHAVLSHTVCPTIRMAE